MTPAIRRTAWIGALGLLVAASTASAQEGPPVAGIVTRQPELIEFAEATLPEPEVMSAASVLLDIVIGPDGAVEDTSVLESAGPVYDAAAQDAVRRFVFAPGEVDGVPARFRVQYRYEFLGLGAEVVVHAATRRAEAVSTRVVADEARDLPGTTGDVVRAVENLGGVGRASLGSGALIVWGAAPEDTTVLVDGVPVPRLYHDGGLRSVVGSDLVGAVDLVPGGYGAAWGRGLGALVSVETREFDEGLHGSVSADLYDAAASLHGRVGERLELGLAGRYGWVGPLLSAFRPGVADVFPVPSYRDAQARIGVRLRGGERLDLLGLASSDRTERTAPSADPARTASDERRLGFQRVAVRYERDQGDGTALTALAFAGADQVDDAARFGPVETSTSSHVTLGGARATWRRRVTAAVDVEVGLDALVQSTDAARRGSVAMPPREGDVRVFGQPPPDRIATDAWQVVTVNVAPHAALEAGLLDERLRVVAGLRFDPHARSVSRASPKTATGPETGLLLQDPRLEPRLSVRFAPTEAVWVTAAGGLYGQPPRASDLSAAFGNPTLPVSRGAHAVLGAGVRPIEALTVEATGFLTATDRLAVRNPAAQPARSRALVADGTGRSFGAQAQVRLAGWKGWTGWLAYTLAWSQRRDGPDAAWRPSDFDQRHVLTAFAAVELPWGFEVGARARLATGFPRTEVVGALHDARRDLFQPMFGAHNGARLPTFFQVDARVAKRFDLPRGGLEAWLEVQNATNRANVEEWVYSPDFSVRGAITGLPVLPALGLRWSF